MKKRPIPVKGAEFHQKGNSLISGHPVQKSITIYFHPCNPVLLPQNNCSILFCGIFLSNLFVYLVAFGNILRKLEKGVSMISHDMYSRGLFSYESCKTNAKVITLANHKRHRPSSEPIKANSSSQCKV